MLAVATPSSVYSYPSSSLKFSTIPPIDNNIYPVSVSLSGFIDVILYENKFPSYPPISSSPDVALFISSIGDNSSVTSISFNSSSVKFVTFIPYDQSFLPFPICDVSSRLSLACFITFVLVAFATDVPFTVNVILEFTLSWSSAKSFTFNSNSLSTVAPGAIVPASIVICLSAFSIYSYCILNV